MAGSGADWFARRLGQAPQAPVQQPQSTPPGMVPYGYQQGPAPGQAYYAPAVQQPQQPIYQPQPNQYGQLPPGGPQDDGLLVQDEPTLLRAARAAAATGGTRQAQQHMRECPECGKVLYVTTKHDRGVERTHAHCYNCGWQDGVRDGSAVASARAGRGNGLVAPSRQYDTASHPVTVDASDTGQGMYVTFEPNRRES